VNNKSKLTEITCRVLEWARLRQLLLKMVLIPVTQ